MKRSWGVPPWQRGEFPARRLELSQQPDVAIVGGGLTGVSAAYHLARRGVKTVLLEAGCIGDGASGRTGGIVLDGTATGVLDGTGACLATLERLVRDEAIDCNLSLRGCWEIEHRHGGESDALPWSDEGLPVRVVRTVAGGVVDPTALLVGLARAGAEAGAVIHEHTPVRRIITGPPPVLEFKDGVLRPGFVIVAVNTWTRTLLPDVRPLETALTFACATEPLEPSTVREIGLGPGLPFYTVDLPYLWGRTLADGRVVFGAGLTFGSVPDLERLDVLEGGPRTVFDRLEARIRKLSPPLAQVRFSARWAGPIAIPQNYTPFLGMLPHSPTVLVAGGYSGHGVALSVWCGGVLARAVVEREPLPSWGAIN